MYDKGSICIVWFGFGAFLSVGSACAFVSYYLFYRVDLLQEEPQMIRYVLDFLMLLLRFLKLLISFFGRFLR